MVLRDQFTGAARPSCKPLARGCGSAAARTLHQPARPAGRQLEQPERLRHTGQALSKRCHELSPEARRRRHANAKAAEPDGQSPDLQLRSDSDDPSQANLFEPGDESDDALAAPEPNLSATMTPVPTAYRPIPCGTTVSSTPRRCSTEACSPSRGGNLMRRRRPIVRTCCALPPACSADC